MRLLTLAIVALCQLPLPVGHDHSELGRIGQGESVARHLAVFHASDMPCCGWHLHLVPAAFWGGGGAEDATGIPAPETDGSRGVLLIDLVSGSVFAPALSAVDRPVVVCETTGAGARGAAPSHFLGTYGPGSELSDLLGVARC